MIKEKLKILVDSGVIDEDTQNYILKVLQYLLEREVINSIEQADVFLTHLAMADTRRKSNELISSLDDFVLSEIESDPKYWHSKELWQDLNKMVDKDFEEAELDYLYLHIINLLKEE
ncbi:PRD domain-containing protein [Vagococcus bubulae]|uniref:PRD domain-containing protein n=1 Tax=Vagococcus bubulae TaxID=1977868 RepID=A0A429ZFF7_9ENTE|nr:PRD domain-containing protein [Vagococcus bubulae]RST92452.1 hypothetical protein CBF36_08775 [Vagococcus bubulae]